MELLGTGTPNSIGAQRVACLPNHVVGKGMFAELRRQYPNANIASIDYDPGASEINQLNRSKLVVATAFKNAAGSATLPLVEAEAGSQPVLLQVRPLG